MPLLKGKKNIGHNIEEMEATGHPFDRARAAALRVAYDVHRAYGGRNKESNPVWWHGSVSGDMRGGKTGLHLGTRAAAEDALHSRIGFPAEGAWDGSREYGKTLLAGKKRILEQNKYGITGRNMRAPEEDYYAHQHPEGPLKYSNGDAVPIDSKPSIRPFRIVGGMTNSPSTPHGDWKANGYMQAALKRGNAKNGYFYKNEGEDSGSISAVVPNGSHLSPVNEEVATPTGWNTPKLRADGGPLSSFPNPAPVTQTEPYPSAPKVHTGPIHSSVAGRTDHLPVEVPSGSYVLPADIISAMGEGNTNAGFKVFKRALESMRREFAGVPYGSGAQPYSHRGGPYGTGSSPYNRDLGKPYGNPLPGHASGGSTGGNVRVVVAGGEYTLTPEEVAAIGGGDMQLGHRALDDFIRTYRAKTIKTLQKLPGPKTD